MNVNYVSPRIPIKTKVTSLSRAAFKTPTCGNARTGRVFAGRRDAGAGGGVTFARFSCVATPREQRITDGGTRGDAFPRRPETISGATFCSRKLYAKVTFDREIIRQGKNLKVPNIKRKRYRFCFFSSSRIGK